MQRVTTPIDTNWEVAERIPAGYDVNLLTGGEKTWIPATVPGHVHTDLIRAGVIQDPFQRLGEWGARWIDDANWTYRTHFTVTEEQLSSVGAGRHFLHFHSLDTLARIFLNGTQIGVSSNYFVPLTLDVTETLISGENTLRVEFDSALVFGRTQSQAYLGDGTSNHGQQTYFNFPPRSFVRKPQYMFGWDWGPELVSCGFPGAVELISVPTAELIDWKLDYTFLDSNTVDAHFTLTIRKYDDTPLIAMVAIFAAGDTTPETIIDGGPGDYTVTLTVSEFETERWTPNGLPGSRKRHFANLRVLSLDRAPLHILPISIGFREIKLDQTDGGFCFVVNGSPLFIKGANWIPDHSLPTQITSEQLRKKLTAARDAGFNMLRIWGGGLYESDTFYALCDELGILVWQDFALACAMYPDDLPEFVESVRAEAVVNVRRIRHHPSLALWCGGNENVELFQNRWSGAAQATQFYGEHLIHALFPEVLAAEDPSTPYWPNSPFGGENCTSEDIGDAHYWNVWHSKEPGSNGDWTNYTKCDTRFSSEFGFGSPAGLTAWKSALSPEDLTVDSLASRWHDKTRKGYETYLGFIGMHFPKPQTFDDLLYFGQANQALALRYGIEHWRRRKGRCWGTLFWQLNDCWPTHSWAVIDSAGEPKLAYYAIKRAYAPLLLSLYRVGDTVEAHLVNDTLEVLSGTLTLTLTTFDGTELANVSVLARVGANVASGVVATLDVATRPDAFVRATFGESEAFLLLEEPKNLAVREQKPTVSLSGSTISIHSTEFAAFVTLSIDDSPTQPTFSDNGFHLAPGQTREIQLSGSAPHVWEALPVEKIRVQHL